MKTPIYSQHFPLNFTRCALIVPGMAAALLVSTACSHQSQKVISRNQQPQQNAAEPSSAELKPVALTGAAVPVDSAPVRSTEPSAVKEKKTPKNILFSSRDFGVSFRYPRQYAFLNARTIGSDSERKPQADGSESQIALARVEIPKGYYPETDFDSGYFALSLNPRLNEKQCLAVPQASGVPSDGVSSLNIDGTEFRGSQVRSGGGGHSALVRRYVTFTNSTCYEFELALKTSNEDGMAREVDQQRVMDRLEAIMGSVKILPTAETVAPQVADSTATGGGPQSK
ncbi:MAG TPA: hypothetical protein VFA89_03125 [Terriglobales bacterium]|nr:hypothetical protein [Terriglobales bacterium]